MPSSRRQRSYDHRLVALVRETRDVSIARARGIPRSTVSGWLRRAPRPVTAADEGAEALAALRRQVAVLQQRNKQLWAVLRVVFVLFHIVKPDIARLRIPAAQKARLLRAVERTREVLGLRRVLALFGLSAARLQSWRVAAKACELDDQPSCPRTSPQRLTSAEILTMRQFATSDDLRHVPTGRLALLAQRRGAVFASTSTWYRMVRTRQWRRPRTRVHPQPNVEGIRATAPNQIWHIDTTIVKLLDGTRLYLHAVIDNFSRRVLSWRLFEKFGAANSVDVLLEAGRRARLLPEGPTVLADDGVENVNAKVDELVESGLLRRVLAQTEIRFSNSMIEAWWRSLKHNWLFLNPLDSIGRVRSLVAFYVDEHNGQIPHSAFRGQTPDEMYFGTGDAVPEALVAARAEARATRLAENRATRCPACA